MPTAVRLLRFNQSPTNILVIKTFDIRQVACAILGKTGLVQACKVASVGHIAQHTCSKIHAYAYEIALVLVERSRQVVDRIHLIGIMTPMVPFVLVLALIAVEAVEIAHRIRQVGRIYREMVMGDKVLGVVVEANGAIMHGAVTGLEEERLSIIGIMIAFAIVIHICNYSALKTQIGIVPQGWQNAKTPTLFYRVGTNHKSTTE